jgi:hypothetical protein
VHLDGRVITGDPKMPHFAFKLSPTYRITRVIVTECLSQDYYRLESGGVMHIAELHMSAADAIGHGKQKILELERALAKTQQKINERKAALKNAETMAKAY